MDMYILTSVVEIISRKTVSTSNIYIHRKNIQIPCMVIQWDFNGNMLIPIVNSHCWDNRTDSIHGIFTYKSHSGKFTIIIPMLKHYGFMQLSI